MPNPIPGGNIENAIMLEHVVYVCNKPMHMYTYNGLFSNNLLVSVHTRGLSSVPGEWFEGHLMVVWG